MFSQRKREMIIKYFVIVLILRSKGDGSNFNYMKTLTREKSSVRVSIYRYGVV